MTRDEAQPAWEKIVDKGFSDYGELNRNQRIWFNVEPLTTDGIIDHYVNHGAEHNADTIEDLEFLGFSSIADLMRKLNGYFPDGKPPVEIDERNAQFSKISESLIDEVDEAFLEESDDLEEALLKHINDTGIGQE